ncbi:alpha/beta hydrolase family protein [Chryseobacterium culicis]|uniref:alpha/beta hydrolase family protein n=1 Tax=Chryseobacterium culicis TaxID=680127 RepID=UPI002898C922|nr:prolyl oligopeptidase family serine peptidase [Chryseobacterium culicis]
MKDLFKLALLLIALNYCSAQNITDTTYEWKLKFGKLAVPNLSTNGRWIAIKKFYRKKPDTAFLYDTQSRKEIGYILCSGVVEFVGNQGVIGISGNKAQYFNLISRKNIEYPNIKNMYVLNEAMSFALLTKDNILKLYNIDGEKIHEISDIQGQILVNAGKTLFLTRKVANKWLVVKTNGTQDSAIYSTYQHIKKIQLPSSGDKIFVTEEYSAQNNDRLSIIGTMQKDNILLSLDIPKNAETKIDNLGSDYIYLINTKVKTPRDNNKLVEIWYGNDSFLNEPEIFYDTRTTWIWNSNLKKLSLISDSKNTEILSLNNRRFLLTYNPRKDYNYLTSAPKLNSVQLLDLETGFIKELGNLKRIYQVKRGARVKDLNEEIVCSPNGKWFLASENGRNWILYNANGQKKALLENRDLELPVFSKNKDIIYFESPDGLWEYHIAKSKMLQLKMSAGKIVKIKNKITKKNGPSLIAYLETDKVLLEEYEKNTAETSYSMIVKGKWHSLVPTTTRRINSFVYNPETKSVLTLEENFDLPPSLFIYRRNKPAKTFLDGSLMDKDAHLIKQRILTYSALGKNLNGILYYPKNYDQSKIYPMAVHIYEVQRYDSNQYLSPNNQMPVGFQVRVLLEKGYFVYLPDVIVGSDGTGLSALECLNRAMDAVTKVKSIDINKVALIGHSHGGYETNFIATHSNRFKTYISGAGNSDIIRSYYSYNYNFAKPFYFQFETGQYQMGTSVAEDKIRYLSNSPILNVENVRAPILLWSGRKDENIATDQVTEFYIGLRRYKKDVIALFYPNGEHSFTIESPEERDLNFRILDWLDYFLKGKKGFKWIEIQMKKDA